VQLKKHDFVEEGSGNLNTKSWQFDSCLRLDRDQYFLYSGFWSLSSDEVLLFSHLSYESTKLPKPPVKQKASSFIIQLIIYRKQPVVTCLGPTFQKWRKKYTKSNIGPKSVFVHPSAAEICETKGSP
jgi:hypothetical protein